MFPWAIWGAHCLWAVKQEGDHSPSPLTSSLALVQAGPSNVPSCHLWSILAPCKAPSWKSQVGVEGVVKPTRHL